MIKNWIKVLIILPLIGGMLLCSGCKEGEKITNKDAKETKKEKKAKKEEVLQEPLPDACSLLNAAQVGTQIGKDITEIQTKDGSNAQSKNSRACFFRFEHDGDPNAGVLVQVLGNPLPEEFPDWAKSFITSKKETGEKAFAGGGGEIAYKYKDFPLGVEGAYSHELSKYFWQTGDGRVYMLAFNMNTENEENITAWATELAKFVIASSK